VLEALNSVLNSFHRSIFYQSRLQRVFCWTLLSVLVAALTGLPFSRPSVPADSDATGQRFPCEDCPCGCSTAEFCWDHCCCHDDRQKLAWAEENGVAPPEFLLDRVAKSRIVRRSSVCQSSCCGCSADSTDATANSPGDRRADDPGDTARLQTHVVLMWKAAECRGIQTLWTVLGSACPPTRFSGSDRAAPIVGRLIIGDESFHADATVPEPPVP